MEFVQGLLDLRDKYEAIVVQSFHEDKSFRTALNQVCGCGCGCACVFVCVCVHANVGVVVGVGVGLVV